jgi:hypothetical protein
MSRRRTLYEEVWEGSVSKRHPIEAKAPGLQTFSLDIAEGDLLVIFKEAVTDSLANILDRNEARALLILIRGTDLGSPTKVFQALDSILLEGSKILKEAITEEFLANADLLLRKAAKKNPTADSIHLFAPFPR